MRGNVRGKCRRYLIVRISHSGLKSGVLPCPWELWELWELPPLSGCQLDGQAILRWLGNLTLAIADATRLRHTNTHQDKGANTSTRVHSGNNLKNCRKCVHHYRLKARKRGLMNIFSSLKLQTYQTYIRHALKVFKWLSVPFLASFLKTETLVMDNYCPSLISYHF